ncbi:MAG: TolC family protein [Terriglobales bacterium]
MNSSRFRAVVLTAALLTASLGAQTILHFHLNTPRVMQVQGLRQRVQNGQLRLSLDGFLQLALKNDTQILLLSLNEDSARYGVIAANSPFDPALTASFGSSRAIQPQRTQTSGASTLSSLDQTSAIGFTQLLPTGQTVQASFGTTRDSSNSLFSTFNPSLAGDLGFSFAQPLLQNRGNLQNKVPQEIAKTQVLVVGDQTRASIASEIVTDADAYWNAVDAAQQVKVQQEGLKVAQQSYARNAEMLKLGALAPGDIFTSEAQVAQDQTSLLQAQSRYDQDLDQIRRIIGADIDPVARQATIVLDENPAGETPTLPALSLQQATKLALSHRPELDALQRQQIENSFSLAKAKDLLRPQLSLVGSYGSNALAGNPIATTTALGVTNGGQATGFSNALGQLFGFGYPTYGFSLQLTLPLRNSNAESALANSLLAQTSTSYQLRNEEQQVRQDVKTADIQLRSEVQVVASAIKAEQLTQQYVDAQNQEYILGTTTLFQLLQAEVQLSSAESSVVSAYTSYQTAKIAYERAIWTLLPSLHLTVAP